MSPEKINADFLRAALRSAEEKLRQTLIDLEANDVDDETVTGRLKEIERNLRRLAVAA